MVELSWANPCSGQFLVALCLGGLVSFVIVKIVRISVLAPVLLGGSGLLGHSVVAAASAWISIVEG